MKVDYVYRYIPHIVAQFSAMKLGTQVQCRCVYKVFQESSPLPKTFGIFSLQLSLSAQSFANLLAIHIQTYYPLVGYPDLLPIGRISRPTTHW